MDLSVRVPARARLRRLTVAETVTRGHDATMSTELVAPPTNVEIAYMAMSDLCGQYTFEYTIPLSSEQGDATVCAVPLLNSYADWSVDGSSDGPRLTFEQVFPKAPLPMTKAVANLALALFSACTRTGGRNLREGTSPLSFDTVSAKDIDSDGRPEEGFRVTARDCRLADVYLGVEIMRTMQTFFDLPATGFAWSRRGTKHPGKTGVMHGGGGVFCEPGCVPKYCTDPAAGLESHERSWWERPYIPPEGIKETLHHER